MKGIWNRKRIWPSIIGLAPAALLLAQAVMPLPASAQQADVFLNGKKVSGASAVIENGRILVPCRALSDALGAGIAWDEATRTVTMTREKTTLKLTVDDTNAYQNGELRALDEPCRIFDGRSYAPLRFVVEGLGATVKWDAAKMQALIDDRYCPVCVKLP